MATTYKVVKGDTLWDIVQKPAYSKLIAGNTINAKIKTLVKINKIKDPDYIVVGQVLKLSGSTATTASTNSKAPVIEAFGLRASSDREMYAKWSSNGLTNVKQYEVRWRYQIKENNGKDNLWFSVTNSVDDNACFYTAPEDALQVKFKVRAEFNAKDNEKATYSDWTSEKAYTFVDAPPKPAAPDFTIDGTKCVLSISESDGDLGGTKVLFEVWKNDTSKSATSGEVTINTGQAVWVSLGAIQPGNYYKARCKIRKYVGEDPIDSEWSDYSESIISGPVTPNLRSVVAEDSDRVKVTWDRITNSSFSKISYEIEYVEDDPNLFYASDQATSVTGIEDTGTWIISGLTTGTLYYFRIRAVAEGIGVAGGSAASDWTTIEDIIAVRLGTRPSAPTTWSSASTVVLGQPIYLYWVHNSEDGSSEEEALIRYRVAGSNAAWTQKLIQHSSEEEIDDVQSYEFDTSDYPHGAEIEWAVSTKGISFSSNTAEVYSPYSETRTFKIYAEPELNITLDGLSLDDEGLEQILTKFPINVIASCEPYNSDPQSPIGYSLEIKSNMDYETVNYRGEDVIVREGDVIYSKFFDTLELDIELTPTDLELSDNVSYNITCVMAMDSGLVATHSTDFITRFEEIDMPLVVTIEEEQLYTARIIVDIGGSQDRFRLSIYRREYDGRFTEVVTNLRSEYYAFFINDIHASMDICRYRIVVIHEQTGAMVYEDISKELFADKAVAIQWDEPWEAYADEEDTYYPTHSAQSFLKLPYNIDVTDSRQPEVSLIKYIGRENPVTYYGTQMGETSAWNVVIDAEDKETIYALRRLSSWKGDVYVREPSGMGYWANVKVSFSQKHMDLTIPVTLDITRVEGGK